MQTNICLNIRIPIIGRIQLNHAKILDLDVQPIASYIRLVNNYRLITSSQ